MRIVAQITNEREPVIVGTETEKKETDRPGRKNIRPIILTAFTSILLGSFHRYLNIVASSRFKSKKRNREGKQRGSNASDQFALTKNSPPEIRLLPNFLVVPGNRSLARARLAPNGETRKYAPRVSSRAQRNRETCSSPRPSTFDSVLLVPPETDPPIIRPVFYKFTVIYERCWVHSMQTRSSLSPIIGRISHVLRRN